MTSERWPASCAAAGSSSGTDRTNGGRIMKALTERRPKLIGISAVIVIVVAVVGILTLNRGIFSSGYQVTARFADAAGITKGTDVMVAGVKVGTVTGVTVHGNCGRRRTHRQPLRPAPA